MPQTASIYHFQSKQKRAHRRTWTSNKFNPYVLRFINTVKSAAPVKQHNLELGRPVDSGSQIDFWVLKSAKVQSSPWASS